MLVDRAGRLITQAGEHAAFDLTTFASLAAADFAASDQLAVLLGEREFASLYHHGEQQSMYLADIGGRAILATLFDSHTTLGLVRVMSRKYVPQLGGVFDDAAARGVSGEHVQMDAEWVEEVESESDRLFSERGDAAGVDGQLREPRDQLQARVLWSGAGRQDDEPRVRLREGEPGDARQADLARDRAGTHALLRLPARRSGCDSRVQDALPPLYRAGAGLLQRKPPPDSQGRGRHRVRGGFAGGADGREHRRDGEPLREPG